MDTGAVRPCAPCKTDAGIMEVMLMTYDLIKLTIVLGLATVPLLFVSKVFLAGIRRTAAKRLTDTPIDQVTTIQWRVRASPPAPAAAALDIDLDFPSMQPATL